MAEGLTGRERYFRRIESLALSSREVTELPLVAAPPTHHDGVMVALVPDDPEQLAIDHEEALPPADLHVTLCYLGKIDNLSYLDQSNILGKANRICAAIGHAFSTSADGVIIMGQNDDGVPATALLIQADEIVELYDALAEELEYKSNYPSFIPHMTMGYGVPVEDVQPRTGQPITFTKVIVKFGDDIFTIPLTSALTAAPRSVNVIDRVVDSLGRLWDEGLHPRDAEGRFIKKNGAVSGQLAVPTADRKSVTMVDANRASVVGFHTFGDEVWVLAEITNQDGSTSQGFARATNVRSVAPIKARLDPLYPVNDERGNAFMNAAMERKRQLDLLLSHITAEYGPGSDEDGAIEFIESLGLTEKDLDYIFGAPDDTSHLGGIRRIYHEPSGDELDEIEDIIEDARTIKTLRSRVHGLKEDPYGFSAEDAHLAPKQQLLQGDPPEAEIITALDGGADPLSLSTSNLLGAMQASSRFNKITPTGRTGVSPIEWYTDPSDQTDNPVWLAGASRTTRDRAYFVKRSVIGSEFGNSDIANEVVASLISEQVGRDGGGLRIPKSVFGDNPVWDGESPPENLSLDDFSKTHQPGHVVSEHAGYLVPTDWKTTDAAIEEVALQNDIKGLDPLIQEDQKAAYYEDIGDLYGNDIAKMILWDFVILNGDRNAGNALLASSPDGRQSAVIPIDHGFAFDTDEFLGGGPDRTFGWFMNRDFTKAWRNYIRGGLDLDNNVTRESLREASESFVNIHKNLSVEQILSAFRAMPGVTDEQVARIEESLDGVVDRIAWLGDNMETVLDALTGRAV